MKDSYLINYTLFCQRKKFSLESFIQQNSLMSENDIQNYFREKLVEPPPLTLINEIKSRLLASKKLEVADVSSIKEEEPQPKKKTRKRRKKKDV